MRARVIARFSPPRGLCVLAAALVTVAWPATGLAHVEVVPEDSAAGETQRYGIRVPTEKPTPTVRVEVQFPPALRVLDFEASAGWQVSVQTDAGGRPLDAVWQGASIPANQYVEFGLRARNPDGAADLQWAVIQTYQDGSEVQWVGPPSAESPAAVTRVRPRAPFGTAELLAGVGVALGLLALALTLLAWRGGRYSRSVGPVESAKR